jgi:asparagine synthase (glutamine-hydrolysing)
MVQGMDIQTYLPNDILTKVDVASMIHSLETRTPLVDVRLAEIAFRIPSHLSISSNSTGGWTGKLILKKVLEKNFYTKDFLNRPKMGFAIPIKRWFSPEGSLYHDLINRLLGKDSLLGEFFKPSAIHSIIKENLAGKVWILFFLEEWLRQNRRDLSLSIR